MGFSDGFTEGELNIKKNKNSIVYTHKNARKSSFKVIGIGSTGYKLIRALYNLNNKEIELILIDTHNNAWWQKYDRAICIGLQDCKGLPVFHFKKEIINKAINDSEQDILKVIDNSKKIFIFGKNDYLSNNFLEFVLVKLGENKNIEIKHMFF